MKTLRTALKAAALCVTASLTGCMVARPAYVAPAPAHYGSSYYVPRPVYVAPRPAYVPPPAPVMVRPAPVYAPQPVYVAPRVRGTIVIR